MSHQTGALAVVAVPTILLIDDDADIRDDMKMILEDQGYRVITAADGHAGLQRAIADRPDLIVCDMMMPKMSGFIVLERVKQLQHLNTPFIMLTANISDQQRAFAEFLGVDAYLNKPIGIKPLLEQMRKFCPAPPAQSMHSTLVPEATAV